MFGSMWTPLSGLPEEWGGGLSMPCCTSVIAGGPALAFLSWASNQGPSHGKGGQTDADRPLAQDTACCGQAPLPEGRPGGTGNGTGALLTRSLETANVDTGELVFALLHNRCAAWVSHSLLSALGPALEQ